MSLIGKMLRFGLRPASRVGEQLRESTERIRRMRSEHEAQIEQARARLLEDGSAQLDPSQRFESLYQAQGWNEDKLGVQLSAVRRTKIAAMLSALLGTIGAATLVVTAPLWMLIVFVPAAGGLTALGIAMTLKYGLFQAQIEQRRLLTMREYLCRPDLFAHLFGARGGR